MNGLAQIFQGVRGWVYPPVCGVCDEPMDSGRQVERPFLCQECESRLKPIEDGYCEVCGQRYEAPLMGTFQCANCQGRELAFDFAVSAWRSSGAARELMHRFKYGKQLHLSRLMGSLISGVWNDRRLSEGTWVVVPVPLHSKRLRERGYNQSREIAVEMIRNAPAGLDLRLEPLLRRARHTVRQAQLDREERLLNPVGAFSLKKTRRLSQIQSGEEEIRILLVDDVMTTGSTVSECAAVLREALEPEVIAAVSVMRG